MAIASGSTPPRKVRAVGTTGWDEWLCISFFPASGIGVDGCELPYSFTSAQLEAVRRPSARSRSACPGTGLAQASTPRRDARAGTHQGCGVARGDLVCSLMNRADDLRTWRRG